MRKLILFFLICSACVNPDKKAQTTVFSDQTNSGGITARPTCNGAAEGSVKTGYIAPVSPCVRATQTCLQGMWNGPTLFDSCIDSNTGMPQ